MNYSEKLKNPKWQKKRLEIMQRDNFKCAYCNDEETTLNVHHKKYNGEPWESKNEDLETVCEDCHGIIHKVMVKRENLPDKIIKIKSEAELFGFRILILLYDKIFTVHAKNLNNSTYQDLNALEKEWVKLINDYYYE